EVAEVVGDGVAGDRRAAGAGRWIEADGGLTVAGDGGDVDGRAGYVGRGLRGHAVGRRGGRPGADGIGGGDGEGIGDAVAQPGNDQRRSRPADGEVAEVVGDGVAGDRRPATAGRRIEADGGLAVAGDGGHVE